jgi:microcystin-dependent protein
MSCPDCFNGCAEVVSDKCITYTGPDNAAVPICQGDSLYQLEQAIIAKLANATNATGIIPSTTLGCAFLTTLLNGADKNLDTLLDVYQKALCSLKTDVTAIQASMGTATSFTTSCLTGLPANPTKDQIIQALLNKVCAMDTRLLAVEGDYVKASQLDSLIASYIAGNTSTVQQGSKLVPFVANPYFGPLSNFDNSGKGLSSTGFDKVYICNGANGTPDLRGRTIVGAIQGVPGGALDPAVDPALPANAGNNYALNQKFGYSSITLVETQMPSHTHGITDPTHSHDILALEIGPGPTGNNTNIGNFSPKVKNTTSSATGVTLKNAGGSQAHDNRQPSIAAYFIMYLP